MAFHVQSGLLSFAQRRGHAFEELSLFLLGDHLGLLYPGLLDQHPIPRTFGPTAIANTAENIQRRQSTSTGNKKILFRFFQVVFPGIFSGLKNVGKCVATHISPFGA